MTIPAPLPNALPDALPVAGRPETRRAPHGPPRPHRRLATAPLATLTAADLPEPLVIA